MDHRFGNGADVKLMVGYLGINAEHVEGGPCKDIMVFPKKGREFFIFLRAQSLADSSHLLRLLKIKNDVFSVLCWLPSFFLCRDVILNIIILICLL